MEAKPITLALGVNRFLHPKAIDDNECVNAKNIWPNSDRIPSKRFGSQSIGEGPAFNRVPTNLLLPPFSDFDFVSTSFDAGSGKAYVHAGTIDGTITTLEIPYLAGFRPALVPFGRSVYVLPGKYDNAILNFNFVRVYRQAGGALSVGGASLTGSGNADFTPVAACSYRTRMVYGFNHPEDGVRLVFSLPDDPFSCGDDAYNAQTAIPIDMQGDKLVAMVEVSQAPIGSLVEGALLLLGEYTAILCTGVPEVHTFVAPDGNYFGDFRPHRMNFECGCASRETLKQTPYGLMWTGPDDVWQYPKGGLPTRVGTKIRPVLEQTPADRRYLWHAEYHDGAYRLAVAADGQNPAHWDPMWEQWWMDIRDGLVPGDETNAWRMARWWGPQEYRISRAKNTTPIRGTYCMGTERRPNVERKLYALHMGTREDTQPTPFQTFVELDRSDLKVDSANNVGQADWGGGAYTPVNASDEDDNEIATEILTKAYHMEDPNVDKLFLGVELHVRNDDVCELRVDQIIDGGRFTDTEAVRLDVLDGASEFQSVSVEPDENTRDPGKTIQLRIYDVPGWPVVESGINESIGTSAGVMTLIAGFYATISDFLDHIVARIAALVPGTTVIHNQSGSPRTDLATLQKTAGAGLILDVNGDDGAGYVFPKMGFSVVADINLTGGGAVSAVAPCRDKICSSLEFSFILMKYHRFGRRPHGRKDDT